MSDQLPAEPRKRRKNTEFWRACRYLGPYRRIVTISILCAFGVGFISTIGLGAMLPLLRVLINGDTVQSWADQQILQHHGSLSNLPWHLEKARQIASRLPTHPVKAVAVLFLIVFALSLVG